MPLISLYILAITSRYPSDWRFWVFVVVFMALLFAFEIWSAKRRRLALAQVAPSIGFLWLDNMPEKPSDIAFLESGWGQELHNAMKGSGAGCELTLFDFKFVVGSGRAQTTHAQTIAAFRSAHAVLPSFQFGPESAMNKIPAVAAERQFKFVTPLPDVPAQVRHYRLRSNQQTAAQALFDAEMLKFFNDLGLQRQPWFLEGNQEWLLVWQHKNLVSPQRYPWFLQQTSAIAAMIFNCARMKRAAMS